MVSVSRSINGTIYKFCSTNAKRAVAGAGKTKLVTKVVDSTIGRLETMQSEALAYFYCNRGEEPRRNPDNVLRSFVRQLALAGDRGKIHTALLQLYDEKHKQGSNVLHPSECESLLVQFASAYTKVTLILDALDECHPEERTGLIEVFDKLIAGSGNIKILVSSREDHDISQRLTKKSNVGIKATDNSDDIAKFVSREINKGADSKDRTIKIPDQLKREIIDQIFDGSQGM